MPEPHDKRTIISMAVVASAAATLLHEGVGHGVVAWMRGDIPTELTSNHLSSLHPDRWVEAGGTLVNLLAGTIALLARGTPAIAPICVTFAGFSRRSNLLPGAGYSSGILGIGDCNEVIGGAPHQIPLRIVMTSFGAGLYVLVVRRLAVAVHPYCPSRADYNTVSRLPYYAACLFSCAKRGVIPRKQFYNRNIFFNT